MRRLRCFIRGHRDISGWSTYPRCCCGARYDWLAGRWSKAPQKPKPVVVEISHIEPPRRKVKEWV